VLRDLLTSCGHEFIGYVDDLNSGAEIVGDYSRTSVLHPPGSCGIVIAIGYQHLVERWKIYNRVVADGYPVPALIHSRAYVRDPGAIGQGASVMAGAVVDFSASVGALAVLWPGVVINHDSVVGANTFVSPNATVCGFATIGHSCFIGAGAVVVDHRSVPDGSFIKSGRIYS